MTEVRIPDSIKRKMLGSRMYKLQRDGKKSVSSPFRFDSRVIKPGFFQQLKNWLKKFFKTR